MHTPHTPPPRSATVERPSRSILNKIVNFKGINRIFPYKIVRYA